MSAREDYDVAGLSKRAAHRAALRHPTGTGRRDEDAVALAAFGDLGVAGDDDDARLLGCVAHGLDDSLQVGQRKSLLEDEAGCQPSRASADHG